MRYMIVNCKSEKGEAHECVYCPTAIGKTFVRDLQTKLPYCSVACMQVHIFESTQYLLTHMGGTDARPLR